MPGAVQVGALQENEEVSAQTAPRRGNTEAL